MLRELIALPGPAGQEDAVREAVARHVESLGYSHTTDSKGNLLVDLGKGDPKIVVTAHLDEIAMIVRQVQADGSLRVGPLGGMRPWKLGEGPVQVLADEPLTGVLSFGSVHTSSADSVSERAEAGPLDWEMAQVLTGLSPEAVHRKGVRPGIRVVVHPCRRDLLEVGPWVAGYFLDDRADLVAWLLALELLKGADLPVLFAATVSEEVGGHGALYLLDGFRPDICVALELGPDVPDAPVVLDDQPTVWAIDSFAAMDAADAGLIANLGKELGLTLQWQALSSGGSDATCAASHGHCARPITLGLPMANSHGFEVIHPGSMSNLANLTAALVQRLASGSESAKR